MTPAERSQAYCPSEWAVIEPIRVLLLTPTEADAHDPLPPYQFDPESRLSWYETESGGALAFYLGVFGLFAFWFMAGWLISQWAS